MYTLAVPVVSNRIEALGGKQAVLSELRRLGAERVILSLGRLKRNKAQREYELKCLEENARFFKRNGLETAAWMWSFWFSEKIDYTEITYADGALAESFACPLDEDFRAFVSQYVQQVAQCGVDIIQFDDDFRFGFLTGSKSIACTCPLHMRRIQQIVGETLTPEELERKIITGGRNKYRDAWMQVNADALKTYARTIRAAIDAQNPEIRAGFCSCMSVWDADGVDSATLARILAGGTKPLLRLIGAPYWAVDKAFQRSRLQNVIDLARMERSWCADDIEICTEGDVYPRPRTACPSSYIELFDMAMRVDGRMDGIMKYVIDYSAPVGYERGYTEAHLRNRSVYEDVDRLFSGKEAVGVRVYESMCKIRDMVVPPHIGNGGAFYDFFFSPASRVLADNSIPSTFEGEGICGIAFGENIRYVPQEAFRRGMMIDARAAMILAQNGVDTGFASIGKPIRSLMEYFEEYRITTEYTGDFISYEAALQDGAVVLSSLVLNGERADEPPLKNPFVFRYENKDGQKFLVFNLEAYFCSDSILRGYARSRQIAESVEWMTGQKLAAYAYGSPDLYILCKEKDGRKAVALFNMFADAVCEPVIELDAECGETEFIRCTGETRGNKVYLSRIEPFSFAGFETGK